MYLTGRGCWIASSILLTRFASSANIPLPLQFDTFSLVLALAEAAKHMISYEEMMSAAEAEATAAAFGNGNDLIVDFVVRRQLNDAD